MIDPATFEYYQTNAPFYTASGAQGQSRHLDGFLARLPAGADVLEIGCGGGRDSSYIIEHGFNLDATDGIPAMAAKAHERFNVGARVMRFDELDAIEAYDAVWAHACLLHCPRAKLPDVLGRIIRSLRSGGWHFANYKLGDGEGRDLLGRLHNFPHPSWLRDRYREAGFEIVEDDIYPGQAADGTQRDWIALTVRKP